ncbi:MAG: hypothetical protein NTY22_01760, partial [Proteobacteria bacterium]|nr:hypothetical protein [Pseudomonadota bacterium]
PRHIDEKTGTKVLFWTGVTASTVATIMSSGLLSFTMPAAIMGVIGQVALATDVLFITAQGYEAWQLYDLNKDVKRNNSAYYSAVQNTLMALDNINDQKREAIKSMFTMAVIAAVIPGVRIVKSQFNDGFKVIAEENGVVVKEKIIPRHIDEKTGMETEGTITVKKTPSKIKTETTTVTVKNSIEDISEKDPNAISYDRTTIWENSSDGTTVRTKRKRTVTKEVKPITTLQERPGVKTSAPTKVIRNNETVPTIVSETIATEIKPIDGINVEIIKTMETEEKTVFNSSEILQTNVNKLKKKQEILEQYKDGKLDLKPATVEKLERDIKTLENKINKLIGRNELQRTTIKEKEIKEDGSTTTTHTVTSKTNAARYKFQGPTEEHIQTSTERLRNTFAKLGIKGERIEPIVQSLGKQIAYFSNFLEETRMCMAMSRDNGFSAYASSTMWRLASSKFTAGAGTSLYMYWVANGNFGKNTADIDGDMVGQAVKAYGGAGLSTIHLIGKKPTSTTSLFLKSDTYDVYRQGIKESLVDQPGVFRRFIKTWPKATLWSAGSKVVSGSVYYFGNDLLGNGAIDEHGDQAIKASLVRLGYGVAWAVPSTALEVTLYNFIIGATCLIPGAKIFLNVSDGMIRAVNFTTASGVQLLYPLMTNWVYYNLSNVNYDQFNLHKINKKTGFAETNQDMDTYDLNVENIKSQVISLEEYSSAMASGKIDRKKSYLVEIPDY